MTDKVYNFSVEHDLDKLDDVADTILMIQAWYNFRNNIKVQRYETKKDYLK